MFLLKSSCLDLNTSYVVALVGMWILHSDL